MDDVYVKSFNGKFIKVVKIAITVDSANLFMIQNEGTGLLKAEDGLFFIADNKDFGIDEK